jgi:hypothetical protein
VRSLPLPIMAASWRMRREVTAFRRRRNEAQAPSYCQPIDPKSRVPVEKSTDDPIVTPTRILPRHLGNKVNKVARDRRPARASLRWGTLRRARYAVRIPNSIKTESPPYRTLRGSGRRRPNDRAGGGDANLFLGSAHGRRLTPANDNTGMELYWGEDSAVFMEEVLSCLAHQPCQ